MWPAVSRSGAIACCLSLACWTGGSHAPVVTQLESGARDISGSYWCTIDEETRSPCMIKKVGEKLVVAMLGGTARVRGQIMLDDKDGFTFAGEMYCPDEDCERQELHGKFKPIGRGGFKGSFREDAMVLHMAPAPANAFGGSEYGGDEYGDPFDVGSYGGYGYGGSRRYRIDIRGRRRP